MSSTRPSSGFGVAAGDLNGGDVAFNVAVVRRLLAGEQGPCVTPYCSMPPPASRPTTAEGSRWSTASSGLSRAADAVDTGAAKEKLGSWLTATSR